MPTAPSSILDARNLRIGVAAAVAGTTIWGLSPLVYAELGRMGAGASEIIAHRALWSAATLGLICLLSADRRARMPEPARNPRLLVFTALAAVFIACNWLGFVYAVQADRTSEAALGYYIYPLLTVVLGRVVFGEALTRLQWLAFCFAFAGAAWMAVRAGAPPWIGLILASTFALYGVVRKIAPIGPIVGVFWESLIAAPFAIAYLIWLGGGVFFDSPAHTLALASLGLITGAPLALFVEATRRLSYASAGVLFYIAPTLQFLLAATVFGEPMGARLVGFVLIWIGVGLYCRDLFRRS